MAEGRILHAQLTLSALVICLLCGCAIAQYQPFHCRRANVDCKQGSCNAAGACVCNTGYEGPDCGLLSSSIRPTMCIGRECTNNGKCYYDGSVHRCYCPAAFFGERCEKERVSMSCGGGQLNAFISPYGNSAAGFSGRMYMFNYPNDATCQFSRVMQNGFPGFGIQLNLGNNTGCSQARQKLTIEGYDAIRYRVLVRYDRRITSKFDERHTLTCVFKENGTLTATISTGFNETVFQTLTGTNARRGYQPVTLVVKESGPEQKIVSAPVLVGDDLYLEFELPENDIIYTNYQVDTCIAYDSDANITQITEEFALVRNSCPDSEASSVVSRILREGRRVKILFSAFKFDDTSLVRFVCQITLCDQNTTDSCDHNYDNCTTNQSNRKRRQTFTRELKTDVIGQSIQVYDSTTRRAIGGTDVVVCDMTLFYVILAVLAAFALLTLICAIYLCFNMARRRRKYDTIVIRKRVLPNGNIIRSVEEVHPADSNSSDRGPIIRQ